MYVIIRHKLNQRGCNLIARKRVDTMTKKEMYVAMMNKYAFTVEEKAFIEHEIELLERKKTGERKLTATQTENISLKEDILSYLVENSNRIFTVSELIKEVDTLNELSNQKVSALMTQLKEEHKVVKTIEKRKSYFSIA